MVQVDRSSGSRYASLGFGQDGGRRNQQDREGQLAQTAGGYTLHPNLLLRSNGLSALSRPAEQRMPIAVEAYRRVGSRAPLFTREAGF